jgi:hypothetical protein
MADGGPGPKMVLDQVEAAERVVQDSVQQMEAVAQQLRAQGGLSLTAMKAPAGQITSSNYDAHSGAGRALAETLAQLQADLARTRQVLLAGSDQASQVAGRVEVGVGGLGGSVGGLSSQL